MKRTFEVEMTCTVTLTIDDEIHPVHTDAEYAQDTILTRYANPEFQRAYYGDIGRDRTLMDLAVQCGVDSRNVSNVDGWADFPDEAVSASWPRWDPSALIVSETTPGVSDAK